MNALEAPDWARDGEPDGPGSPDDRYGKHPDCTVCKKLAEKLDTLREATKNYGGNDPIYFDILDALNSEEIK